MANRRRTETIVAGVADPQAVAAWSEDLSDAFIMCRDFGHNWKPFTARWIPDERCYERSLRCSRCRTERRQTLSQTGLPLSSYYAYPEGYEAPRGTGRLDGDARGALRLESTMRLIHKEEEKAARSA